VRYPRYTRKKNPRRVAVSGGFLCLPALAVPVKPLANIVADYARSDRHEECGEVFHGIHPLLLPVWGRAAELL